MRRLTIALTLALTALAAPAMADPAEEVLALVNRARAAAGCGPLTMDAQLTRAATAHARAMARQNFFSHTGKNGSTLRSRARAAGYHGGALAENIAAGWTTPERTVERWLGSKGHRKNMLSCSYRTTGIGVVYDPEDAPLPGQKYAYKYYWVQDFGDH